MHEVAKHAEVPEEALIYSSEAIEVSDFLMRCLQDKAPFPFEDLTQLLNNRFCQVLLLADSAFDRCYSLLPADKRGELFTMLKEWQTWLKPQIPDYAEAFENNPAAEVAQAVSSSLRHWVNSGASLGLRHIARETAVAIDQDAKGILDTPAFIEQVTKRYELLGKISKAAASRSELKLVTNEIIDDIYTLKQRLLLRDLPKFNWDIFETRRLEIGAKGAALEQLSELRSQSNYLQKLFTVPPFRTLPIEVYEQWQKGIDHDPALREIYEQFKGQAVHVRSSAVHSEDGIQRAGEGIYVSIRLKPEASFEEFRSAVHAVFNSCNSTMALEYRKREGIADIAEQMGVIVQLSVPQDLLESHSCGTADSYVPGHPELMRVRQTFRSGEYEESVDMPLRKDLLENRQDLAIGRHAPSALYFPLDHSQIHEGSFLHAGAILLALKEVYGPEFQFEFVVSEDQDQPVNIVQIRSTEGRQSYATVSFPTGLIPDYKARSIGTCDVELPILSAGVDNSQNHGLVILRGSYGARFNLNGNSLKSIPQSGAVWLLNPGLNGNAHIETFCARNGIPCIFSANEEDARRAISAVDRNEHCKMARVVADGIEGAIYFEQ